jgi:PKD repeat protein
MKNIHLYFITVALLILLVGIASAAPPECKLKIDPTSGNAPLTVKVSEVSGDKSIIDWGYDFGDEQYLYHEAKGEHTYDKAGEYTVKLRVINAVGEEAFDSAIVTVSGTVTPTPTITQTPFIKNVTKVIVIYEGNTTIKDALTAKAKSNFDILKENTDAVMKEVKFPYTIKVGDVEKTEIVVEKYRCDITLSCGYWIAATRNGEEVQVNSPICIQTPPYLVLVSMSAVNINSTYSEKTITVKEDPKSAVEQELIGYVNRQPLGKSTVGTKE